MTPLQLVWLEWSLMLLAKITALPLLSAEKLPANARPARRTINAVAAVGLYMTTVNGSRSIDACPASTASRTTSAVAAVGLYMTTVNGNRSADACAASTASRTTSAVAAGCLHLAAVNGDRTANA